MERVEADDRLWLPPPTQPMDVARRFVGEQWLTGDQLTLRAWRGGWWRWARVAWTEVDQAEVRERAYRFTETAKYLHVIKDGEEERPWAPTRTKVADLLEALRAVTHTLADEMPAWLRPTLVPARELVSVSNGLLHVSSRRLLPHDPQYWNQVAVPFEYNATSPPPSRWLEFLRQLWGEDQESIEALQEWFGYVISGRIDLHKILMLIGPTRSGKGTIARVLQALVGRGNHCGPTLASLGTNFGLSPLIGKPLAIIADARLGGGDAHTVVERLLSISGEDALTIDRKYREPWTGTLPTRFLVISNELPRFGDASGAIAGRFVILSLSKSFMGKENHALTGELLQELPGILRWSLDGLDRLNHQDRFTEPKSSVDAIVALADLVSPVAAFVRDQCERGPYQVPVDDLWTAWTAWAEDNGHRRRDKQSLGRDLGAVVPGLRVRRPRMEDAPRFRVYEGLRLTGTHNGEGRGPSRTTAENGPLPEPGPRWSATQPIVGPGLFDCPTCGGPTVRLADRRFCPTCAAAQQVTNT